MIYHNPATPLYLLAVYAKAVREDLTPEAKKALAEFASRIKRAQRRRGEPKPAQPVHPQTIRQDTNLSAGGTLVAGSWLGSDES